MRWVIVLLVVLLLVIQQRLWFGDGGLHEIKVRQQEIKARETENQRLRDRNAALRADVDNLEQGVDAIEERARGELGMIQDGEVFYQVIAAPPADETPVGTPGDPADAVSARSGD